ncbi:hypothetical protein GCM10009745_41150 [Kribbella yunnanensis]|uniref:Cupin type-1 domain-containing protein n=2 Tax=Kribbella yunnanensis TaxID=190194 RepID=A0ABP4TR23_9ACTN
MLYTAYRNVQIQEISDGGFWHADEVHYESGSLETSEPVRSIGHWNKPDQVEIFQVTSGRVMMIVVPRSPVDVIYAANYAAGDSCVIPLGAFHLTYSPWTASTVFNISFEGAAPPDQKYDRHPAPEISAVLESNRIRLETPAGMSVKTDQLSPVLSSVPSDLAKFLCAARPSDLAELRAEVAALTAAGWPAR